MTDSTSHKKKLYCYVDETGQDTRQESKNQEESFLVAVVVSGEERDELQKRLEEIEKRSGKGLVKWRGSRFEFRLNYIRDVMQLPAKLGTLHFAQYKNQAQEGFLDLTVETVALVVESHAPYDRLTVIVDGLKPQEITKFKYRLNARRIHSRKIVGARDESDALIRLADALAGFVRDALEELEQVKAGTLRRSPQSLPILEAALRTGRVVEQKKNPHG